MKRVVVFMCLLCVSVSILLRTQKSCFGAEVDEVLVTAKSAVVMEASTGKVLFAKNPNEILPPASVTKVMSLLLIYEAMEDGKFKKSDMVTISEHSASMGGSQVFLEVNETQKVDDLLKCMVISSANDATVAMAEKVAGSESAFVKRMNEKAKKLGMKHTKFQNCCGLDTKNHRTTAKDIALMSRELIMKYPDVFHYTKIWMDTIVHRTKKENKTFGLSNTNKMIRQYTGCNGLKTGSTSEAKFCLSATAKRSGIQMIAVVMASSSSKERIVDASKLLDYGFSKCQKIKRITRKDEIGTFQIKGGTKSYLSPESKITSKFVLVHSSPEIHLKKIIKKKKLIAPVKKGDIVGYIQFKEGSKIVCKTNIYAKNDVFKAKYMDYFQKVIKKYI